MGIRMIGALAGGLADGGVLGLRARSDLAEEERRQQETNQRVQESEIRLRAAKQAESDNIALRQTAAPMVDGAGGVATPTYADNRDVGQTDGPSLGNGQLVNGTAAQANSADAQTLRMADTLRSQGRPDAALKLQRDQATMTREQEERARTIQSEGYMDTARAMQIGDPNAVKETFNRQGKTKIDGDLKVESVERDVPGLGKVPTFNYTGTVVGPDGSKKQMTVNSHDFAMSLFPYKDKLEIGIKAKEAESKQELRGSQSSAALDRAQAALDRATAAGQMAEAATARAEVSRLKAEASGNVNSPDGVKAIAEQRKQATALMADSTKNLSEVRKKINELRRGAPLGIKPGTPEYEELQGYQDEAAKHQTNYDEARAQLAQVGKPAAAAPAPGAAPAAAPANAPAKRPNIASVEGAPAGSTVGKQTPKGWEVLDKTGKLLGYVRN